MKGTKLVLFCCYNIQVCPFSMMQFPSMASLQGALPHVPGSSPLARTSSLGNPSTQWGPSQQSFSPAMPLGNSRVIFTWLLTFASAIEILIFAANQVNTWHSRFLVACPRCCIIIWLWWGKTSKISFISLSNSFSVNCSIHLNTCLRFYSQLNYLFLLEWSAHSS